MKMTAEGLALDLKKTRFATAAFFLVCGFGISSWAPMVPYVKDRLGLDDSQVGLLLLCLGAGAILMMPVTGWLINRVGSRRVMTGAGVLIALSLPLLLVMHTAPLMAVMLFIFGAGVGSIDVAMNAHAVQVQNLAGRPIMSSLHGLFSVGGLCGPLAIGFLMKTGLDPLYAALCVSVLLLMLTFSQAGFLMDAETERTVMLRFSPDIPSEKSGRASWMTGSVFFLGAMCFASFLSEGAILDWSALYLRDAKGVEEALAGAGYAAFSIAMAAMRLVGDRVVSRMAERWVVVGGAFVSVLGFALIIFSPVLFGNLAGFVLVGIGAANIVPVFFSEGGRLRNVPSAVAIPAITTLGYTGQLAGPALLGFIAEHTSLEAAFGFTALLMALVGVSYLFKKS
jgi:MFS family permease